VKFLLTFVPEIRKELEEYLVEQEADIIKKQQKREYGMLQRIIKRSLGYTVNIIMTHKFTSDTTCELEYAMPVEVPGTAALFKKGMEQRFEPQYIKVSYIKPEPKAAGGDEHA
jgi:hypothetical protein